MQNYGRMPQCPSPTTGKIRYLALILSVFSLLATMAAPANKVSDSTATHWLRKVIPLPHEAQIPSSIKVPVTRLKLTLLDNSVLGHNGARRLTTFFRSKTGVETLDGTDFEILLGLVDAQGKMGNLDVPDFQRLKELPNSEQAYLIRPVGENRLVVAALDSRGLYYGALTLEQLLATRIRRNSSTLLQEVELPLAIITDWPDLAERGLWGGTSVRDIEWLAERKMNIVEFHTTHNVEKGKINTTIIPALLRRGNACGVKMVPIISHINHLERRGVYELYPALRGKGAAAKWTDGTSSLYAPCASRPELVEVLAAWMKGYAAADKRVRDICCWLGELRQHCECENCAKSGQFALEARAFVKAWKVACETYPDLRIRILLTQGSYKHNAEVLAEIPPEVGVTYYDGGRTYDSSKDPMIYPVLEDYAAKGRWLGVYPQLTPSWRIESPWSCPQFVKFRMTEFVDKKLQNLIGYVVIDNLMWDFNVTAAAEWSWNAHGRSEEEFSKAWGLKQGISEENLMAEWACSLGAAGWDIYGARLVERYFFRPKTIATMLKSRSAPAFGQGMLRYIPNLEHLQTNLATCRRAVLVAEKIGTSGMLAESQALETYYRMLSAIVHMQMILSTSPVIDGPQRDALQQQMNLLALAGINNAQALHDWERSVRVGAGGGRFRESVEASGATVQAALDALKQHGVREPGISLSPQVVRQWSGKDFDEKQRRKFTIEITDNLRGNNNYSVIFQYTKGWNGLSMYGCALASSPAGDNTPKTVLAKDLHPGSTGHRSKGNVYSLKLTNYDPNKRYWLIADVRGTPLKAQTEGRTGCFGEIRLLPELAPDWAVRIMQTQALSPEELPIPKRKSFNNKGGLRVAVIAGGYGSEGIFSMLKKNKSLDPILVPPGKDCSAHSQVVILPQLIWGAVANEMKTSLINFVKAGGGLIATHDAVGYRSQPNLFPDICGGGIKHTRSGGWQIEAAKHPLAKKLPANKKLTRGFYDQIELAVGPKGKAIASATEGNNPVIVAGAHGKGRYVACGLLLGCDAKTENAPPTSDEATLLLNAIRWCGQKEK